MLVPSLLLSLGANTGRRDFSSPLKIALGEVLAVGLLSKPHVALNTNSAAATAKSLQSCPALCDPIDGSPPGSPIPGILQARILEWVAISFSRTNSNSLYFLPHSVIEVHRITSTTLNTVCQLFQSWQTQFVPLENAPALCYPQTFAVFITLFRHLF